MSDEQLVHPDAQFNDVSVANQLDVNNKFSIGPDYIDFANAPVFCGQGIMLPGLNAASVSANSRGAVLFLDSASGKISVRKPNGSLVVLE
jgi:hypothetical protein